MLLHALRHTFTGRSRNKKDLRRENEYDSGHCAMFTYVMALALRIPRELVQVCFVIRYARDVSHGAGLLLIAG